VTSVARANPAKEPAVPTRLCPSCHRRIVATETRCCYCGRESETVAPERGPAQIIGLDGTVRRGESGQENTSPLIEGVAGDGGERAGVRIGSDRPDGVDAAGFDAEDRWRDPPGAKGYLTEVSTVSEHRFVVSLIFLVLILTIASPAFKEARAWLDATRFVLSIVAQYAVLCTPFRKWSLQLHLTAAMPVLMGPRYFSQQQDGPLYVLQIFTLYATAQAQAIALWKYWRFRRQTPANGHGPSTSTSNDTPSEGKVA
jgi:hypothetical protein